MKIILVIKELCLSFTHHLIFTINIYHFVQNGNYQPSQIIIVTSAYIYRFSGTPILNSIFTRVYTGLVKKINYSFSVQSLEDDPKLKYQKISIIIKFSMI